MFRVKYFQQHHKLMISYQSILNLFIFNLIDDKTNIFL
jgi:hypothetical protein